MAMKFGVSYQGSVVDWKFLGTGSGGKYLKLAERKLLQVGNNFGKKEDFLIYVPPEISLG